MGEVVAFTPPGNDAGVNLNAYIAAARALPFLGVIGVVWDEPEWDLSAVAKPERVGGPVRVNFVAPPALSPSMGAFARAYVAFSLAKNLGKRLTVQKYTKPLVMLRDLAAVMAEWNVTEPRALTPSIFDEVIARRRAAGGAPYGVQQQAMALKWLADDLLQKGLLDVPFVWEASSSRGGRVSRVVPNNPGRSLTADQIAGIAEAFNKARSPREQIATAVLVILCCVPGRISEIFELPENCDAVLDPGDGYQAGLRWWPRKGGAPQTKFVPKAMLPVLIKAIAIIRRLTEPARQLARDVMEGRAHFSMPPKGWPNLPIEQPFPYAEALMVVFPGTMSETHAVDTGTISMITYHQIYCALKGQKGMETVFETLDITLPDGSPLVVDTHQARHYLNTIANKASVPPADIALWSGRRDIRQNATYDHETAEELLVRYRAARGSAPRAPIPIDNETDFDIAQIKETAHTTPWGWCLQSLRQSPCTMFGACLDCTQLVCIKGAAGKLDNIRRVLERERALKAKAQERIDGGLRAAPQWMELFERRISRLEQLVAILERDDVIDGSPVRVAQLDALPQYDPVAFGKAMIGEMEPQTGRLGFSSND